MFGTGKQKYLLLNTMWMMRRRISDCWYPLTSHLRGRIASIEQCTNIMHHTSDYLIWPVPRPQPNQLYLTSSPCNAHESYIVERSFFLVHFALIERGSITFVKCVTRIYGALNKIKIKIEHKSNHIHFLRIFGMLSL